MSENDNTVNISSEKNRYHHGDLRAALIEEGVKLIDAGPADALSLARLNATELQAALKKAAGQRGLSVETRAHLQDSLGTLTEALRATMQRAV